ncbi:MAG: hypothetical protein ACE15B_09865 [Bryobacteraceae bacterium]
MRYTHGSGWELNVERVDAVRELYRRALERMARAGGDDPETRLIAADPRNSRTRGDPPALGPAAAAGRDLVFCAEAPLRVEPPALRDPETALRYAQAASASAGEKDPGHLDVMAEAHFQAGRAPRAVELCLSSPASTTTKTCSPTACARRFPTL